MDSFGSGIHPGEDADAQYMITGSIIESNLMIGNSSNPIVAPIQLRGCEGIIVHANTTSGW
jgi:hypothetical protein